MDTISQLQLPHPIIIMDIKVPHLVENFRHQRKLNRQLKNQQRHQRKNLKMKVVRTLTRVVWKKGLEKEEVQMKEQEGVQKKEQEEVKKKEQRKDQMRTQRKVQMQDQKRAVMRKTMKMM
uniref:Uncharacterized protein n=1 Tax=Meloidogyne enterolobii TaxID=390850 RepID=A0A6V7W7F5_MELEN|nr:unnamed protein product [Meloidogyne enterolobii]